MFLSLILESFRVVYTIMHLPIQQKIAMFALIFCLSSFRFSDSSVIQVHTVLSPLVKHYNIGVSFSNFLSSHHQKTTLRY